MVGVNMAETTNGEAGPSKDNSGRVKLLEELDSFIQTTETHLNDTLSQFGWTRDSLQEKPLLPCIHDPHHLMPESSLSKHEVLCSWRKEGYSREDFNETNSSAFFYHNTNSVFSMTMDQEIQNKVLSQANGSSEILDLSGCPTVKPVARTAERACTAFTQKEKLAIYDYVVAQGQRSRASSSSSKLISEVGEDLDSSTGLKKERENLGTKTMSRLEMLKQMRDYKRRRQSYRAKNVHITKRSQTDIMREIIRNQMEDLGAERESSAVRETASGFPPERDFEKWNESSPKINKMAISQSTDRYSEESEKRQHERYVDQRPRDSRATFGRESNKDEERYRETDESDRYRGIRRPDNGAERDYDRELRRKERSLERGETSFPDVERYTEMAVSGDNTSTPSISPADRSTELEEWHKQSSKPKKHKHHRKHKTADY